MNRVAIGHNPERVVVASGVLDALLVMLLPMRPSMGATDILKRVVLEGSPASCERSDLTRYDLCLVVRERTRVETHRELLAGDARHRGCAAGDRRGGL